MSLGDGIANTANHEGGRVDLAWMITRDERIQTLDLVNETVFGQKIERTIGDGWLRSEAGIGQLVEDRIGAERAVLLQQQFQNLSTHRGKAQSFLCTAFFRHVQGRTHAKGVIMLLKAQGWTIFCAFVLLVACH